MTSAVELVPQLVSFTRDWERFTPNAYPDGTQTSIGYGTKAQPGETTITQAEAERRLNEELTKAAQYVDSVPGAGQLPDSVKMGLTDQAYNAGGFGTGLKSAIAAGDVSAVTGQMDKYRGTSVPGTEQGVSNRVDARLQLANGTYQGRPGSDVPPPQVAAAVTPPLPNLRPNTQVASAQPPSGLPTNDYGAAPQLPQLPQLASYNTSTPQAPSQSPVDDLGGNGTSSTLHQYNVYEPSDVSAGPYGADALVKAAMSGDVNAFNKAMGDLTGAAAKDALTPAFLGGIGMDGVQKKLQDYFNQLQQQSPGAVRAMQTAYNSNPQLAAAVPPQLQSALQDAFKALPAQSTGQVPLPNMRPSNVPQASAPPPLPTPPSGPTMVSDTMSLPPKDASDPRFPPGWSPNQPLPLDAGDAASWPDNAATNFTQPNYWTPSTLNPSQLNAMDGGGGSTVANPPQWKPTVATPPPMPSFNYQPYINSGQIQFSNYGQGGSQAPFFGIPQSQMQSAFNAMVPPPLPLGMPNFGQSAAPKPPVSAPPPLPRAQSMPTPTPQPMTPQQAFMQQAGPAPQNVNWQATLAPDPYAQPGTDNTYVLNDTGYGGGNLGGPGFDAFVYG